MSIKTYSRIFSDPRIAAITLLGFTSGLPLALTSSSLQAWLSDVGYDTRVIGWFAIIGQPYILRILWAPLLDRFALPFLGRRLGWIIFCQLILTSTIAVIAFVNPQTHLFTFGAIAFLIALFAATLETAVDAHRVEIITSNERSGASAVYNLGYRLAMITSGAGTLILADQYGWQFTFLFMAMLMGGFTILSLRVPEPQAPLNPPQTLEDAFFLPLQDFFNRQHALLMFLLVISYKLGDAFIFSLSTKFFLDLGFTKTTVAEVTKIFGLIATIIGSFIAAIVIDKIGLFRGLILFAILQGLATFGFWYLAKVGNDYFLLVWTVGIKNITSGMGTTVYLTLLITLCNKRFSAAQYALLSALWSSNRIYMGPIAGYIAASYGWADFFLWAALFNLPPLILLLFLKTSILQRENAS